MKTQTPFDTTIQSDRYFDQCKKCHTAYETTETYRRGMKRERQRLKAEVEEVIEQFYSDNIEFSPKLRESLKQKLGLSQEEK